MRFCQELGPLAYARCRASNQVLSAQLQEDSFAAAAENSLHFDSLDRIKRAFQAAGIPLVLLKGAALAHTVYEQPALRPMADVDIWLRPKELPEAARLMTELGFRAAGKKARPPALQLLSGGEIRFYRPEWRQGLVELHRSPFPGWWLRRVATVDDGAVWSRREPLPVLGPLIYQLGPEDTVIQLAVHLAVNHQFGLAAVRSLLDIAFTVQKRPVNWMIVAERARWWRVGTATWTVLHLLHHLTDTADSEPALAYLRPSWLRQRWLRRFVSPESVLGGIDLRNSRARYLLLLALVDRPRDMLYLLWRTAWPEREWLDARYQNQCGRGRHLWLLCQGKI